VLYNNINHSSNEITIMALILFFLVLGLAFGPILDEILKYYSAEQRYDGSMRHFRSSLIDVYRLTTIISDNKNRAFSVYK